ncbi:MAG TPA: amino acid permease [Steroidobacteraceae bacterium]|nr:amino acid permease [Steroidobacteraceae bacterium]
MGWRTKSIDQVQKDFDRGELKRTLGPIHLVLFGIGCIIGAGIFVRTGTAAAQYAGPAVMLSFVLAGVVCAFAGLCYAELASMLPVSGSAYTYAYTTVGEFGAWIMGALLLLEYALAASVVAVGWSGYAVSLLHDIGWNLPAALTQPYGELVVAALSTITVVDPSVSLNGVTAALADGSAVQFVTEAKAAIGGSYTAAIAQYDVVKAAENGFTLINALDIPISTDINATLAAATKVLDPATGNLRDLAAGTLLNVPASSVVHLPAATVVSIPAAAVVTSMFNMPAVFIVLAVTALLVYGVSESATVNNIIVAIKVTVILAFIAVGAFFVNTDNWHPFIPEPTGVEDQFGIDGIIRAAMIVFFAYIGFEAVSTAGQEARNPRKDMPIGILGSLVICTILYMATAAVLTGVISFTKLNVAAPVATAVDSFGPEWGWLAKCIKIGAIAGLSSVVLVLMFGQTRVFYSMSRDGLMPKVLAKVHPKYKTPWINTLIVGVLVAFAAAVFDINALGDLTSVGTLFAFGLVCFSVIWLRYKRPDLPRPFKVWGYPVVPAIGVVICFWLAYDGATIKIRWWFFWFLLAAIGLYFVYAYWKSPLRPKNQAEAKPAG